MQLPAECITFISTRLTRYTVYLSDLLLFDVELLLEVADLALEGGDGGLGARLHLGLELHQLGLHLLVLPLQQHAPVLQLLRRVTLRRQVRRQLLKLRPKETEN